MQMGGLLAFYEAVVRAGNDGDWHLQLPVFVPEGAGRRNHKSRFGSTGPDLRRPHSHLLRKALEFLRDRAGPEDFSEEKRPHQPAQEGRYGVAQEVANQRYGWRR